MRGSRAVRVGLSGTSLALAALAVGCSSGEVATKEIQPAAHHIEAGVTDAVTEQEREEARYQRQRREREVLAEAPPSSPDAASPWFLRPAGGIDGSDSTSRPASLQPTGGDQPPIVIHDPPKPKPKPIATPVEPRPQPDRRDGWRIRAACGRG
jgi:outer membrane biosynthesis protein TonB